MNILKITTILGSSLLINSAWAVSSVQGNYKTIASLKGDWKLPYGDILTMPSSGRMLI